MPSSLYLRLRWPFFLVAAAAGGWGLSRHAVHTEAAHQVRPLHGPDELWLGNGTEPETIDPTLCSDSVGGALIDNLFAGLVELDPTDLTPRPDLASRWEERDAGRRYLFSLREAFWSDGHAVTAEDFVFSWRRILTQRTGSRNAGMLSVLKGANAFLAASQDPHFDSTGPIGRALGVRAKNPLCLEVTLAKPTPYFLQLAAHSALRPVPAHLVGPREQAGDHSDAWTDPKTLVTSGPFQVAAWHFKHRIDLVRSETYWVRAHVALARARIFAIEDGHTVLNMYLSGELDWTGPNGDLPHLSLLARRGDLDLFSEPMLSVSFYWFNTRLPFLSDRRVREALSLAVDREAIAERILKGGERPVTSLVPPGLRGYPALSTLAFNPVRARALLAEAGYPPGAHVAPLRLSFNTAQSNKIVAEAIQAMWHTHLGIDVELDNQEWRVFLSTVQSGAFEVARMGWTGDYPDANSFLQDVLAEAGGNNASGWHSASFELALEKASYEVDLTRRQARLAEAEQQAMADWPLLPLFASQRTMLVRPYVHGLVPNVLGRHPLKNLCIGDSLRPQTKS